ncbi:hypothetical protein JFT80_20215 [Pseudomonas sp. TH10]|nr:hypothetical protein [Pseudomonas sp. TH10]
MAFDPCKGILLTRLGRHYREIFAAVVGRIRTCGGEEEGIFGRSEGLQGFGWISRVKIFLINFSGPFVLYKKQPKKRFFTTCCVLSGFSMAPDTTKPDRSRAVKSRDMIS